MQFRTILAASAAVIVGAAAAQAAEVAALSGDNTISIVNTSSKSVTKTWKIQGVSGKVLGIDVRPADGMLYGVTSEGAIVTIDVKSLQATPKSKLSETLKPGVTVTVDFNPVADRLRVMGSDGTSLRVNVDDGKAVVDGSHKFKEGDANAGKTPKIIAGAYSNSVKGTQATALYNLDATTGSLVLQAPPNDGTLNTIGSLGIKLNGNVAFNIVASGPDKNEGWLSMGGALYSVDLKTGKATMVGKIDGLPGFLTDLAWMD